jgi:hypothetical protein
MSLYIVTVITHSDYYLPYLIESCKKNGYELVLLGYGKKWEGFNWRFKLVLDFLNKLNDNDIVCFIDGFDVISCRNLKELPFVFNNMKSKYNFKIIVGEHKIVENNLLKYYINKSILKMYFLECNKKSLNAGTYIGNVKDLKEILNKIYNLDSNNNADDQILLTKYCINNPNDIYIDVNNEIFLTLQNGYQEIDDLLKFNNNMIEYNKHNPFFIHAAGETYLDNVIIKLNYHYDYNNRINNKLFKNRLNKFFFRIKNANIIYVIFIIIFVIMFILSILYLIYKLYRKKIKYRK